MGTSFHRNALCPHIGLKEGGEDLMVTGGLLPFPRTGCVLYAKAVLSYGLRDPPSPSRVKGWNDSTKSHDSDTVLLGENVANNRGGVTSAVNRNRYTTHDERPLGD
jgi:hypothetical protein